MKCNNCQTDISPAFVAAIRDNKCPACGQPCLTEAKYSEIFAIVDQLRVASTDLTDDLCIKVATALHGNFDIFPKGVVVDGYVTKEIVYVPTEPRYEQVQSYRPEGGGQFNHRAVARSGVAQDGRYSLDHYSQQRMAAERSANNGQASAVSTALEQLRANRESQEYQEDFDTSPRTTEELIALEADRRAEAKMREIAAAQQGIVKRRQR